MKKLILFLGVLAVLVPMATAAFDNTRTLECNFLVVCPDGSAVNVVQSIDVCSFGWGFCFSSDTCGQNITLSSVCGGTGGGGAGGGSMCEFDPFGCNPFET